MQGILFILLVLTNLHCFCIAKAKRVEDEKGRI